MPDLRFRVEGAEASAFAAAPTLLLKLRVENAGAEPIRSLTLNAQVRIRTAQRSYDAEERSRLRELFGEPPRWSATLRSMLWTQTTLVVPPFEREALVDLPLACTYDFEVASAKYLAALHDGEVPLELLFSGTVFYTDAAGLQVEQIPWDREARFPLPVRVWREAIEKHFPNSAWLRLRRDVFDRLYAYKVGRGLPTWESAIEALLRGAGDEAER
ncbi:MAG TPA: DUF6084 family protein [Chloroflexota bacterium]